MIQVGLLPAFGFASPWLLVGLGLAAVPIIIHLLFRRPHRELTWAATRFLLAATKKHAKRLRLEQFILLAVRVAILLLVAAALARPYFSTPEAVAGPDPPRHRVIVIDASYSMGQETGGRSRFDLAIEAGREVVDAARPGDAFHLVRMSDLGQRVVIGRAAYQAGQVAETLDELTPSFGRADPVAALRDAERLLGEVRGLPNKEVLILSDFQQADWRPSGPRGEELRRLLDAIGRTATIRVFDAARSQEANRAVVELGVEASFVPVGKPVRFTAVIRQHGEPERQRDRVELHVDGRLVASEMIELRAGESATVAFGHVFAEAGPHAIEVRLPSDGLVADDSRFLAVTARNRLRTLLVNGTAAGSPERTATFYVGRALAPASGSSAAAASDFEPVTIDEGELAGHDLAGYDAVVISNVGILTDREADRLRAFAAAGGGVVLALGDHVELDSYNRLFEEAETKALLPIRLTQRIGDPAAPERAVLFDTSELTHPIVRPFAGNPGTGLDTDFVLAYGKAGLPANSQVEVALRFDTGDPAVLAAPLGLGRIVLLTTSLDTSWAGPWPQTGRSFLPLVHEIVRYAATGRPAGNAFKVGEPLVWKVPLRVAGLQGEIVGPNDLRASVPATLKEQGMQVAFDQTDRPGIYTFSLGSPIAATTAFAVNVDANEGDLTPLGDDERTALAPAARPLIPGLPQELHETNLDRWTLSRRMLALAFGLLLAEQILAWRFAWGVIALAAVGWAFVTRWIWLIDPLWGSVSIVLGAAALAAGTALWRRREPA